MRKARLVFFLAASLVSAGVAFAQTPAAPGAVPPAGRFQLVVVPGHQANPFMIDTATGCLWHAVQDAKTKRYSFTEVDVENLHWSYASGAQTVIASRIDASPITGEQKTALKQNLQKTSCGLFNVTLAPGPAQPGAEAPEIQPITPPEPKKSKK
jgi:ABC-type sugar transport system substrate-binding protein